MQDFNSEYSYNNGEFDFEDVMGSMTVNNEFKKGYTQDKAQVRSGYSYIWNVLSAIGQDTGSVIYSNVMNYIDVVSNIDTCKTKSLKSIASIFGIEKSVASISENTPIEMLNILDVFSVNYSYLKDSKYANQRILQVLSSIYYDFYTDNVWYYKNIQNSFEIYDTGTIDSSLCTDVSLLTGEYSVKYDGYYNIGDRKLPSVDPYKRYDNRIYQNKNGYQIRKIYIESDNYSLFNSQGQFIGTLADEQNFEGVLNVTTTEQSFQIGDIGSISSDNDRDSEFLKENLNKRISLRYISSSKVQVNKRIVDEDRFKSKVYQIIYDILKYYVILPYNTDVDDGYLYNKPIYSFSKFMKKYQGSDGLHDTINEDDEIRKYKIQNNIDLNFDHESIADSIERWEDSLDNYNAQERSLLEIVLDQRKQSFSIDGYASNSGVYFKNKSRYSYYREKKVWEFVDYIEGMFYTIDIGINDNQEYDVDANYFQWRTDDGNRLITGFSGDVEQDIRWDMVERVAEYLSQLICDIQTFREKLKIQTRKNYIKGTLNLLKYVINEYLIQFSKQSIYFKHYEDGKRKYQNIDLQKIYEQLLNHSIDDVDIEEYIDNTEYFNIQTNTTKDSITSGTYTDEFISQYFITDPNSGRIKHLKDPEYFNLNEIISFYRDTLGIKDSIENGDEIENFLSTVYKIGWSNSYIDKDGVFVCQMEDGTYSYEKDRKYRKLLSAYQKFEEYTEGYEFDSTTTVKQQINSVYKDYIYEQIDNTYLPDVSSVYQTFQPQLCTLEQNVEGLVQTYENIVSGEYSYYYQKSNCKYCYQDNDVTKRYKHDYLIGNPNYNSIYILDKINDVIKFDDPQNIRNFPVVDSLTYIGNEYTVCKNTNDVIVNDLKNIDYKPGLEKYIDEKIQSEYNFVNQKYDDKYKEIEKCINSVKNSLQELKSRYNSTEAAFVQAVASYNQDNKFHKLGEDVVREFSLQTVDQNKTIVQDPDGYCQRMDANSIKEDPKSVDTFIEIIFDSLTQKQYAYYGDENGKFPYWETEIDPYDESASLEDRCQQLMDYMNSATACVLTKQEDGSYDIMQEQYGRYSSGTDAVCKTTKNNMEQILGLFDENLQQLTEIGYVIDPSELQGKNTYEKIDYVIKKITNINIDEDFSEDEQFVKYVSLRNRILELSAKYQVLTEEYDTFRTADYSTKYFNGYTVPTKMYDDIFDSMLEYSETTDASNLQKITSKTTECIVSYGDIQLQYYGLVEDIQRYITVYADDNYIEVQIEKLYKQIFQDIKNKTSIALLKIDQERRIVDNSIYIIQDTLGEDIYKVQNVNTVIENHLTALNVTETDEYKMKYQDFMYRSNSSYCEAGPHNYKNITHSTYQVHPFLWNFVLNTDSQDIISRSFTSYYVEQLEEGQARSFVDNIIGQYGQYRDLWKYNIQDFSGYTNRYICNQHTTNFSTNIFEVADYDGIFYPIAVEWYRKDPQKCIDTLSNQITRDGICNRLYVEDTLEEYLSSYGISPLNKTAFTNVLYSEIDGYFSPYLVEDNLYQTVSSYVEQMNVVEISSMGESSVSVTYTTDEKSEDLIRYLQKNVNDTFYGRFYYPIGQTEDECVFIARQLGNEYIRKEIFRITDLKSIATVDDIYKYALDNDNNMYILLKNYGNATPTYKEKRNTLGAIWIRLKDNPIAFPMIMPEEYREYAQLDTGYENTPLYLSSNVYLEGITDKYCFDFEFSDNKNILMMVCQKTKYDIKDVQIDEFFQGKYEYASLIPSYIQTNFNTDTNTSRIVLGNKYGQFDDIITGVYRNGFVLPKENDPSNVYSFLGMYRNGQSKINLVFAQKTLNYVNSDSISVSINVDKPKIGILRFTENSQDMDSSPEPETRGTWESNPIVAHSPEVIFTYDNVDNTLYIAYLRQIEGQYIKTHTSPQSMNIEKSTEGGIITDDFKPEMNSFDMFSTHVGVIAAKVNGAKIREVDSKPVVANVNADMSYIPSYPGEQNKNNIYDNIGQRQYYNIELLGKSKNIDKYIDNTNPSPDVNFDYKKVFENNLFGRVYEDWKENYDMSYCSITNPSINSNMGYLQEDKLVWNINMDNLGKYDATYRDFHYDDLKFGRLKVVVYNKNTLGKNPYYMGSLSALSTLTDAFYMDEIKDTSERMISGYESDKIKFRISGTNGSNGNVNITDTNHIENIENIQFKLTNRTLMMFFTKKDKTKDTYISKGTINVLILCDQDMDVFKYYHLLDDYGIVNMRYGKLDYIPKDKVFEDGKWGIKIDTSHYTEEEIMEKYRGFYDKNGKEEYIENIELSDYNFLSDVYVFQTNKRLSFKYSDEDDFEISNYNYYFPTLNMKYPRLMSESADRMFKFSDQMMTYKEYTNIIFNEDDIFVMNLEEPTYILDSIGKVDIPILFNQNTCYRAFEDFDEKTYDVDDARTVHYLRLNNDSDDIIKLSGCIGTVECEKGYELSNMGIYDVQGKTLEQLLNMMELTGEDGEPKGLFPLSSESGILLSKKTYITIEPTSENTDIENLLRMYVNYKREDDKTLTLYFNYFNYINSPYVKLDEDSNIAVDTIDGTYLKLEQDEDGYLDIMLQIKYYLGSVLYGYKNLVLLRYYVKNISDDKPKFYIRKVQQIYKNQYTKENEYYLQEAFVNVNDVLIDDVAVVNYGDETYDFQMDVNIYSEYDISETVIFDFTFEPDVFEMDTSVVPHGYRYEMISEGTVRITTTRPLVNNVRIFMKTILTLKDLAQRKQSIYGTFVENVKIYDKNGNPLTVNIQNGIIQINGIDGMKMCATEQEYGIYTTEGKVGLDIGVISNEKNNYGIVINK